MSNLSVTTKIFNALGNNKNSVIPTLVKDTACNGTITYIYDKNASKADGKERALEEFGTEAIWIGGIPLVKKIIDKTLYKKKNANPEFDVRNLKVSDDGFDRLGFLAKNAPDAGQKELLNSLKNSEALQKQYKNLFLTKFAVGTAVPLALLSGLIILKQQMTNKSLEKQISQMSAKSPLSKAKNAELEKNDTFIAFTAKNKKQEDVSFKGGFTKAVSDYMFNPLRNQSILDGGITVTRLAQARKGEIGEIAFKEAFTIAMYYFLAQPIQKGVEALTKAIFKKPISNEYKLLSHKELPKFLQEEGLKESIETLSNLGSEKEVYEYVYTKDNALTKMLKISGDIPTIKNTDYQIDALKFLDVKDVKATTKNISELLEASTKQADLPKFLSKVKFAKGASILVNLAIGVFAVGILQPALTIAGRKKKNGGEATNPAIKNIERQMVQKFS